MKVPYPLSDKYAWLVSKKKSFKSGNNDSSRNGRFPSENKSPKVQSAKMVKDRSGWVNENPPFFPMDGISPWKYVVAKYYDFMQIIAPLFVDQGAGLWDEHYYSFAIVGNYAFPYLYVFYQDVPAASKGEYMASCIRNPKNVMYFESCDKQTGVTETNQKNIYSYLQLNNIRLIPVTEFTRAELAQIADGTISGTLSNLPSRYDDFPGCTTALGMKLKKLQQAIRHVVNDQSFISINEEYKYYQEENVNESEEIPASIPPEDPSGNPVLTGWQKIPGWKAVQWGSTFYHIPIRLNVHFLLTNKLWLEKPECTGWIIVLEMDQGIISGSVGGGYGGLGGSVSLANTEIAAISKWLIIMDMKDKIEYMPEDPASQKFGNYTPDLKNQALAWLKTKYNVLLQWSGLRAVYLWDNMDQRRKDFCLGFISLWEYIRSTGENPNDPNEFLDPGSSFPDDEDFSPVGDDFVGYF